MVRAAWLRMREGEALEDILAGWPALTEDDRARIRAALAAETVPESGGDTI